MKKKQSQWGLLLTLGLMGITLWTVFREQPLGELARVIQGLNPGYLLLGLLLMVAFVGLEAACSKVILTHLEGRSISYRKCMGYSFTGFYFSSITPSATGGQPAQVYYMAKDGIPAAHGTLDMLLVTVCYQVTTLGYALAALILRPGLIAELGGGLGLLLLFGGTVTICLTIGILALMFAPSASGRLANRILSLLARLRLVRDEQGARDRLERQMEAYYQGAQELKRRPTLAPTLLGLTVLQISALYLVPFVVYLAFGLTGHSLFEVVGMQALLTLAVASLPLPGAVGAAEGGFLKGFSLIFGAGLVSPAMLVSRGISFYSFLLISGGITLFVHLDSRRKPALDRPGGLVGRTAIVSME